ncbi:ndufa6 NADH-ubiquinone oxidoreductase subunit [Coemansia sp. RSA 455]|uniref:Ndufa6 NADH-ubiquinone oxidoreductase subunit n=3 Tax=Coemansia TaxID=4863 RepID=A0A9W8LD09_9FUNG|nr:ndufa6 NADH-ubiquinone oxidoreductase subunit [Coemansia sp. S17]KAJ2017491.1 ndufa6 NADH-ubiquinone oxidoreductase subunit [Coemansia sp. S680]KAJ2026049.1 ndufa6 NADH-ubiquinone oxidoreductase subunit [Coemansia sp. S3946]KAJ2052586.1 ndufa6 NADH-ubiquinone oxidoreductase subunit [Coemansia sp. S16]KAJ2059601.1 ndufa6 NADH-ubiquinone oxidoreductase subunit [Coemansia sp. S146]KAJ2076180.1 ndufa6 NADH-ubiquinone oxidoreductase subunit [Coemansia sp. S155-1]KAJ2084828.1 ndufa6 NADH-ubiquin
MPLIQPLVTKSSSSLADARTRAIHLYRLWQKNVPQIMIDYHLCLPQSVVRSKIREHFEKNRYVSDPRTIDVLLFKGRIEFEETYNVWKQYSHVLRYFDANEQDPQPTKFFDKFIEGRV